VDAKRFFDSNVLLYLIGKDERRMAIAKALVEEGGTISVQVLNEFANVAAKKLRMEGGKIVEALMPIRDALQVVPLESETHDLAMEIFSKTNFGVHDCNIIAAAELSGCDVLYTEDMNHGQRIGRVMLRNPFVTA
jgi:predicted nucleic acid-binding protein